MAVGGYMNKDEGKQSPGFYTTADFKPVNINSPYGNVGWTETKNGYAMNTSQNPMDQYTQMLQQSNTNLGIQQLPGYSNPTAGARAGGYDAGNQMAGLFGQMQNQSYSMPQFSQSPGLMNQTVAGYGAGIQNAGQFNNMGLQAGGATMQGAGNASQTGYGLMNNNNTQSLMGDFNGIQTDILQNLRSGVAVDNNYAASSKVSDLMNSGRLGTAGGAQQMRGLDESQRQQDLNFQLASMDFSKGLQSQFQSTMANERNTGANLINSGLSAYGNLTNSGISGGSQLTGLLSGGGNYENLLSDRGISLNALQNSRAQSRFTNAADYFGFANDIDTQNLQNSLAVQSNKTDSFNAFTNFINSSTNASGTATQQPVPLPTLTDPGSAMGKTIGSMGSAIMGGGGGFGV